jgi:glycerol-3-phosphate dehydrogenase
MTSGAGDFDLIIIGGGITGAAAARDAAGRGLSVLLLERRDLGSGTTSRSSRMAHGGLRYLEHLQLGLVRESLVERNRLFRAAPDLVRPARFRLPIARGESRPAWMVGLGLGVYDILSGRRDARREDDGFSYCDGICRPERLAASLAYDAERRGAVIRTYSPVGALDPDGRVTLESGESFRARAVIVAVGPWTDVLLRAWGMAADRPILKPTRGAHIIVAGRIDAPRLLQATSDGRVFFAIPSPGGTLVGTTDLDDDSDPGTIRPRDEEIRYLREEAERRLPGLDTTVRGAWAGLRPLLHSGAAPGARSRGELIAGHPKSPRVVIVVGGKLTTMRSMGERAVNLVERRILDRVPRPWTAEAAIPTCPEEWGVARLSDLFLRRTWAGFEETDDALRARARALAPSRGWDDARMLREFEDFRSEAAEDFGLAAVSAA